MNLGGHVRTVVPRLRDALVTVPEPPSRPWSAAVEDPRIGPVRLSGRLSEGAGSPPLSPDRSASQPLVLLVHGLGGSAESPYLRRAAAAALAAGWAALRLNLRGADGAGEDFFHAGLSSDLHAALASPELAGYAPLYALGFSVGGHLVLRLAAEAADPRLAAVAAVAAPLDLALAAAAFDGPGRGLYRAYVLAALRAQYAAVAARRPVPLPAAQTRRIRFIQEWDEKLVAPRHGFAGARDYYRRESVAGRLGELRRPALLAAALDDPMVPPAALEPALATAPPALEVQWLAAGGHLGFGLSAVVDGDLLGWLARHR